jgi:ABC-type dipeptide/oligopeptide/nickel transport system permease component
VTAALLNRLRDLAILLFGLTLVLFLMLRLAGDPAIVMAGPDATLAQIEALRAQYGLDLPLWQQFAVYLRNVLLLDFGQSLSTGMPAMEKVMSMLPATLLLTVLAMGFTLLVSIPLGAWLGYRPDAPSRRLTAWLVFVGQGVPGFVVGLVLIQVFAVNLGWLPSLGYGSVQHWILPTVSLGAFLIPKLTRVLAANVAEAMREDYIRTARANGARSGELLARYALPNALLGATALVGTQFAFLVSGTVVIEIIFSWPGIGWLLIEATQTLDFPVVQAIAIVVAVLVFFVNLLTDLAFHVLDPRLKKATT